MIVSALVKRYEDTLDVPVGWQKREAAFALDISHDGKLLDILPLGNPNGKKRGSRTLTLPSIGSGRSGKLGYQIAFFLSDVGNYLLGLDPLRFESAKKLHLTLLRDVNTPAARAIAAYFELPPQIPEEASEKVDPQAKYVFMFGGKCIDYDDGDIEIRHCWDAAQKEKKQGERIRCLITGQEDDIIKLHDKVALRGVTMTAQPLISMNDQTSFRSYGSKPGDPPVRMGQYAAFAYAAALNALLKDERHRKFIGGDTLVYWAEKGGEAEEVLFSNLLDPPKVDDEAELSSAVSSIVKGDFVSDIDTERRFHLLCLSPNAARISVRFFYTDSFGGLSENIRRHYNHLDIIGDNKTPFTLLPLWLLLSETTIKQSASDASPLLGGQVLKSILTNTAYPFTLFNAIITRIRAGSPINKTKAAIIKAVLIKNYDEREVTTVALNEQSEKTPYVLGRLFAVLEMLQERANGSSTIRERYFTSASANPSSVFPTLLNLSVHHSAKLDNPVYFEKLKSGLIFRLDGESPFPATLSMDDQGRFIVGYYHQRQSFFTKKDASENKEETNHEQ